MWFPYVQFSEILLSRTGKNGRGGEGTPSIFMYELNVGPEKLGPWSLRHQGFIGTNLPLVRDPSHT